MAADVMMQLGDYQFSINSAAYQTLKRSTEYRWAAQTLIGGHDDLQFTGFGADSITLEGVIFAEFRGGTGQIEAMRTAAANGLPMLMVDGLGFIHGRWVVLRLDEEQSVFARSGVPRKQQFTMQIRYFDDGAVI